MTSFFFFFFKQKTAYEMRISDWSSDVCSSDLQRRGEDRAEAPAFRFLRLQIGIAAAAPQDGDAAVALGEVGDPPGAQVRLAQHIVDAGVHAEIGRASCRERVCS